MQSRHSGSNRQSGAHNCYNPEMARIDHCEPLTPFSSHITRCCSASHRTRAIYIALLLGAAHSERLYHFKGAHSKVHIHACVQEHICLRANDTKNIHLLCSRIRIDHKNMRPNPITFARAFSRDGNMRRERDETRDKRKTSQSLKF